MRNRLRDYLPQGLHSFLYTVREAITFQAYRYYQFAAVARAKRAAKSRPLKVLFLVNSVPKWKTQSLYDLMVRDPRFSPMVALTVADDSLSLSPDERVAKFEADAQFFGKRGIAVSHAYDLARGKWLDLRVFKPDIVFFQQPWYVDDVQQPREVAKFALTCYVPYFVQNFGKISVDCMRGFHCYLWRYFMLNKAWCDIFDKKVNRFTCLPKFVPSGHTMIDEVLSSSAAMSRGGDYVIYAPHWSFSYPNHPNFENFSTFLKNGQMILEYAKAHPEIKWAFRPHPTLKVVLLRTGAMTREAVDAYYRAWEEIGLASYSGDYVPLFFLSRALITDCASFLVEYACTGNPIIHLISSDRKLEPMKPSADLFATYYQAHDETEMRQWFSTVVEQGEDPKREERLAAVKRSGLLDVNAGENIMQQLRQDLQMEGA